VIDSIHIDPNTFLRDHCTLPALPEVLIRMQDILDSDHIDIDEVADLMRGDPALVGQILKVVNSAYYGLPVEVADVKYAISYLGLNEIHRIMLTFAIVDAFMSDYKEELQALWFHSFHTALCADYLAKKNRAEIYTSDCWSAALLHDVGKLVYLKFFPSQFMALNEYARKNACLFSTAEIALDLPTSAYLGTLLCDHWRLPLIVRDSCKSHTLEALYEGLHNTTYPQVLGLVTVCNLLTTVSTGTLADPIEKEIRTAVMQTMGYDQTEFDGLVKIVEDLKVDAETSMHQVTS
jgi:HD-like signal output (HDOD) protein